MKKLRTMSPTILTCLGAIGTITTSVLAVKGTPKAIRKIRSDSCINHDGSPDSYTKIEAVKSAWIYYVPATIAGVSTIVCILGANILNKRQQASISSAYALLNSSYQEYKNKLKELCGEETHQKIVNALAVEKAKDVYISANCICRCSSLYFDEQNPEDIRLFYDTFSKRYFESTIPRVLEAEYHLNRNWCLGGEITVNEFYKFLGIEPIEGGNKLGWDYSDGLAWIDFIHHKTVLDDGLKVYIIEFMFAPAELDED